MKFRAHIPMLHGITRDTVYTSVSFDNPADTIIKVLLRNGEIYSRLQDADTRVADIRKEWLWVRPSPACDADAPKAH